jgi:hypothetical protein
MIQCFVLTIEMETSCCKYIELEQHENVLYKLLSLEYVIYIYIILQRLSILKTAEGPKKRVILSYLSKR